MITFVPARREHVEPVASAMRQSDRDEVWAWSMRDPESSLLFSLGCSPLSWAAMLNDEPVALFGVGASSLLGSQGSPWFLGTDALDRVNRTTFARLSRAWMQRMTIFPTLGNWSDARHTEAHGWLEWLGFRLGDPQPAGALGLPFRPFVMEVARV